MYENMTHGFLALALLKLSRNSPLFDFSLHDRNMMFMSGRVGHGEGEPQGDLVPI